MEKLRTKLNASTELIGGEENVASRTRVITLHTDPDSYREDPGHELTPEELRDVALGVSDTLNSSPATSQNPTGWRMRTTWIRPGNSWWISRIFPTELFWPYAAMARASSSLRLC
jgi:hypothetical protein